MNVWPPIVSVPVRELVLVLAVADQVTDPLPVPLAGEHVSQLVALLVAVQPQPAPVVTLTAPVPAPEPGFATDGEIEYVHAVVVCDRLRVTAPKTPL